MKGMQEMKKVEAKAKSKAFTTELTETTEKNTHGKGKSKDKKQLTTCLRADTHRQAGNTGSHGENRINGLGFPTYSKGET